ncbi:unnamed protein product [Plutella xylostella]|uniref:(diamondback moth) hypothetical protein n=1 Tax=Plutella xylostella TaxID=51655 RepID=A0A8S4FXJ3_PLUXY|nr:unnamed protein product [Plutella xylostella]
MYNVINKTDKIRPTILIGVEFSRPEMLSGCLSADSRAAMAARLADSSSGQVEPEPPHAPQAAMQAYVAATVARDKTIADCVEALIGTYLLSSGIPGAVKVLEWFRILPKEDNFKEYLNKPVPTALSMGKIQVNDIDYLLNNCRIDIERKLNYTFRDPTFLLEALSHPSYIRNRHTRSYERLEFLGDAVLDLLITAHCFEHCRALRPGELTDLRSALVNNVTFAAYVVKLGLHKLVFIEIKGLITADCFEHCRALRPGELTDLRSALVNNVTFAAYVVKLGLHKLVLIEIEQRNYSNVNKYEL